MKNIHIRDEFEKDSSWISISSLKKAANMSAVIETFQSEYSLPVNMSEMTEWKTLEKFNDSVSDEPLKFLKSHRPASYSHLLKVIFRLNEEIQILSQQLKSSNKQIESLNQQLSEVQQENAIKLQTMQEKHEKRLHKSKNDLDFLLKDLNMKSVAMMAEQFLKKHNEDIESVKENYEKQIEQLRTLHENELIAKEVEAEKNLFHLKQRFFKYLSEVEKKFKHDLNRVRYRYGKEASLSKGYTEDGLSDDEELSDLEKEFCSRSKKYSIGGSRLAAKMSITDLFDRFSCESGASTRRDSNN
jgi:hypothetical protein